jgi:uncharacterized protein GlcG (DUF336 family)
MADISLSDAKRVVEAALQKAQEIDTLMNIAVVDAGGNLKAFNRMDGAWLGSIDISIRKARTARFFDMNTGDIGALSQPGGPHYNIEVSNGGLITFPGGIPLRDGSGQVVGGIGVSGSTVENDHTVAEAGAKSTREAFDADLADFVAGLASARSCSILPTRGPVAEVGPRVVARRAAHRAAQRPRTRALSPVAGHASTRSSYKSVFTAATTRSTAGKVDATARPCPAVTAPPSTPRAPQRSARGRGTAARPARRGPPTRPGRGPRNVLRLEVAGMADVPAAPKMLCNCGAQPCTVNGPGVARLGCRSSWPWDLSGR